MENMGVRPESARETIDGTTLSFPELHDMEKPTHSIAVRKQESTFRVQETNADVEYTGPGHTHEDQRDMRRLGKKQELRRNFRFTSILGFVAIAMGTWEVILSATAAGLTNGGTGGMIWMFVGSYFCFGTIVLSLAEMSSMA